MKGGEVGPPDLLLHLGEPLLHGGLVLGVHPLQQGLHQPPLRLLQLHPGQEALCNCSISIHPSIQPASPPDPSHLLPQHLILCLGFLPQL